jgi:acetate kinase
MRVLAVNAGSSSLKVDVVADGVVVEASYDDLPSAPPKVDAVGHRIVHGGREFTEPVVIDADVEKRLRALVDLAPLHQPKSLAGLDAARTLLPDIPHVGCFDTAFHATIPAAAATFALPREWRERWEIRRYGFHGLSHAWSSRRAAHMVPDARRIVVAHLGAGASLAAVLDGRSVDTTMGFTPLDGLVMATRSGSVDPGLLLWLEEHEGLSPHQIAEVLEHRSGLLGLAGNPDMRELLSREDDEARLALAVYLHRLASSIAAMTVALGGLDALVFTGGVGERSAQIRAGVGTRLQHLGVTIDEGRNRRATRNVDAEVSAAGSSVAVLVVTAREALEIARCTEAILEPSGRPSPAEVEDLPG